MASRSQRGAKKYRQKRKARNIRSQKRHRDAKQRIGIDVWHSEKFLRSRQYQDILDANEAE